MFKFFTIAVAVAVMPLSQQFSKQHVVFGDNAEWSPYVFPFKNIINKNPFEPEKKPAENWSRDWMAVAQENIRKSEYRFKWEEKYKAYCTPNRKNNLRFFYNEKGFTAEPRTTQIPIGDCSATKRPDEIKYKRIPNWKIKFILDKKQVGKGAWQVAANKAEYISDKITVQYINSDEGMRQNFIVRSPLSKRNRLKINFRIKTKLKACLHGNQLQFFHKRSGNVLNYDQLAVWDANGKPLPAAIKKNKRNKYFISVNTVDAKYPITIDPLSASPDSTPDDANQSAAFFGYSVASAGDVNGDGYSDVIIGAYQYNVGANFNEGEAFVYYGSSTGLSSIPNNNPDDADQANAYFGYSVASAGDVNGDGYSDVVIGAYLYDDLLYPNIGRAYVYYGSPGGLSPSPDVILDDAVQTNAYFGFSVSGAGDVNGDGYSDVVIGAYLYNDGASLDEGAAFIYMGSAGGLSATHTIILKEANQADAYFGFNVASAGDVNGDGYSDVIIGAYQYDGGFTDEGGAFIYHGSAGGLTAIPNIILSGANQVNAYFGYSVASTGDVNGDGYSDVIIGAIQYDDGANINEGGAFVYHGSASGLSATPNSILKDANQVSADFGFSVASAGDVNGDGYSDVIAGAPNYDDGANINEGRAFVYFGSSLGLSASPNSTLDDANQANALFGTSVASAGDVNGDGYSDVIIGAPEFDDGANTDEGRAFVYHGSPGGISITSAASVESNQSGAFLGISVAGAGDVNGDGYSDVIVGAYQYDNGQTDEGEVFIYHGTPTGINIVAAATLQSNQVSAWLGYSVACAGDVNGDGYSDVIVGAYQYDNGQTDEGAAFIYHGSVTGINPVAATTLESNQASAGLGYSVAGAGDVNGDGYSDVIVGAYLFDNGQTDEGAAFVYHGSATGIGTTAAATVESNQPGAELGISVGGAGDVNGDGQSDVIVGAFLYDNGQTDEGAAFVYHGSLTGINTTPASMVESNQANAELGRSVAGAGDVNGDGYTDVIVGAHLFDNGQADEGTAFVYHGSATGISTTAAATMESNQANAQFGISVAGAGDVNGDGYTDVIVGAYLFDNGQADEGAAFVYHGSPAGINTTVASMVESNQANAGSGRSVSGAGDVNGDGYSDVIVGAYQYDNGQTNEGSALVYLGNSPGTNKRNNLRMYNSNLTTPINSSNFFIGHFGAGLFTKSFLGRQKGKLVWETRLSYNAYNGNPITNSTYFTSEQGTYTDLGLTGVELKNLIAKLLGAQKFTKVRTRVKYSPVTAITGQVYGPWRNAASIIDGNSLGALPIELVSFNAAWLQKGRSAQLNFTTDKESGICCFDIQKSPDGFNFSTIGTVAARNLPGIQSYSFVDNNARDKKQFYRLKIKGVSGQVEYSNIQQLQNNTATEILVFPNPATDVLQLLLNGAYDNLNVQIVNTLGQTVKKISNLSASGQTLTIPVNNLPAGIYWLHLQSGGISQILQFVKK